MFGNASRRSVRIQALLAASYAALAVLLGALAAGSAAAQQGTPPVQRSYINPFPTGDRYRVLVIGDSLGEGLWTGLYRNFEEDNTIEFVKHTRPNGGLLSSTWESDLADALKDGTYQIAVVMYGANDDQSMKVNGEWVKVGSDAWRQAYGERVEAVIKKLRAANLAVYWVGLPIMRSPTQSADAQAMNEVYREKAFINGAKYIDIWNGFMDEGGRFSAYGPDMTGQAKRLRADDGVLFTMRGNVKLAGYVEKELRRDLAVAKQERNIPLAGSVEEQAKVTGHDLGPAPSPETAGAAADDAAPAEPAQPAQAPAPAEAQAAAQGQGSAEPPAPSQGQAGDVNVVRPEMDRALQTAAQTLATPGAAAATPDTEMITSELGDGLTAVATLSSVTDISLASSKPRLPLSQRPYYRVLIKGEQLKPKAGRADDFAWPHS
ncbi:MAG TPA: GDSL-type esterase/lipase family protein [Methyloceanibacter sp.]|nr:GDSL-type esterase/lipase family protein [Methyloceanibacter sp.]